MKANLKLEPIIWILVVFGIAIPIRGQGTFIYDQQSSTSESPPGIVDQIQPRQPFGQSFTPAFSSVGFIRLYLEDSVIPNGPGATIHLSLLSDSITGAVVAVTSPIIMPGGFFGYTNFFFPTSVPVTPGTTYYFQPVIDSGNPYTQLLLGAFYSGGTAFINGVAQPNEDLWFREGIVPEPSSAVLFLTGIGAFVCVRRFRKKNRVHENKTET